MSTLPLSRISIDPYSFANRMYPHPTHDDDDDDDDDDDFDCDTVDLHIGSGDGLHECPRSG